MSLFSSSKHWLLFIIFLLIPLSINAQSTNAVKIEKQSIFIMPLKNLTTNTEYIGLGYAVRNVLSMNLEKQKHLKLLPFDEELEKSYNSLNFENFLEYLSTDENCEVFIFGDYYLAVDYLRITIRVLETSSFRVKNIFLRDLPLGQDRYEILDNMITEIAVSISRDLPAIDRDAIMEKQITAQLRRKLDHDENILNNLLQKQNEITLTLPLGLSLGRSIISWNDNFPPVFLPLALSYSRYINPSFLIESDIEILFLEINHPGSSIYSFGLNLLLGYHSPSLFSFGFKSGIALTYDWNDSASALASDVDSSPPSAERFSLSIPLIADLSIYLTQDFFINLRLSDYALSWTIEPNNLEDYSTGISRLFYYNGFSPLNVLSLSLSASIGVRF